MSSEVSSSSSEWNPALASRRASVPMEIIIGGIMSEIISITIDSDGKPIFTAAPSSNVGSPVLPERRKVGDKEKKKVDSRSGSKKRSSSQKKKTTTTTALQKATKKKEVLDKERESSEDSQTSLMNINMATCSIGAPAPRGSKQIEHLPEYDFVRKELVVTVRDAVIQTDLF
ncbi:Protein CBG00407 [Caenorhabditis briggsae]|uniref:Protein CBG00407 n=2 Tax=Caenorhabditis briggsae TaxID=6238 RepID=A8WN07_CAEBR|nr:Protein CBG00407 [Caenorhabditis briggsae]CAP21862.2 Protein CBG00407 [Caenorhabditis briggsae]